MNTTTVLLDASALQESSCILRLHRKVVQGYSLAIQPNDVVFGSGCHTFFKFKDETKDDMKSLAAGLDYFNKTPKFIKKDKGFLNALYLTDVCLGYEAARGNDGFQLVKFDNGNPFVEQRVAYPYYITPERDIEVILCGTLDALVYNYVAGFYAIKDYKTTCLWDIQKYFSSYALSTQLMMYKLLLTLYGKLIPDTVLSKAISQPLGCFIDGIFLGKDKPPRYERSEVFFYSEERMAEFQRGLDIFIQEKLVPSIREPEKYLFREGMINKSCERVFGPCDFFESCCKDSGEERDLILSEMFSRRMYNPMLHGT